MPKFISRRAPNPYGNGVKRVTITPLSAYEPKRRACKACGERTRTPLRKWCESCRLSLTADEKRAFYAEV